MAPLGIRYACQDCYEPHAVRVSIADRELLALVEPGHDPDLVWKGLQAFMRSERLI